MKGEEVRRVDEIGGGRRGIKKGMRKGGRSRETAEPLGEE